MSKKKKKVKSEKAENKKSGKKAMKKDPRPSAKKNAAKTTAKPAKEKKVIKKPVAKAQKPAKKTVTSKKILVKKTVKPAKIKVVAKKSKPVKPVKKAVPVKKVAVKKVSVKKTAPKPVAKALKLTTKTTKAPVSKKAEVKKEAAKPARVVTHTPIPVSKKESHAPVEKIKKSEEISSKKQLAEKRSNEVLAITNTIPVKAKNEISLSKIASISHSITNPVKKTDSYAIKPEKEPNGKFELEFVVHSSAEMLYEFLSTPSGLSEWFCDDLNIRNGIYTFIWDDQLQQARLLKTVDLQLVRFQWVDKTDGSYFEFRIQRDDLTNDISLIITDFAESAGDRESSKLLWHSQIEKLMQVIGSIF
jgi:uncharacterized protein YndB with AHSA1/START domain